MITTESDETHECPADGCKRRVVVEQLACKHHWFKVSAVTRNLVLRSYRSGDFGEHHAAMQKAIEEMNADG